MNNTAKWEFATLNVHVKKENKNEQNLKEQPDQEGQPGQSSNKSENMLTDSDCQKSTNFLPIVNQHEMHSVGMGAQVTQSMRMRSNRAYRKVSKLQKICPLKMLLVSS